VEERKMKKGNKATVKATAKKATVCDMEAVIRGFCENADFRDIAEKMLHTMQSELKSQMERKHKLSFVAPQKVAYSLVSDKVKITNKGGRNPKNVYVHKGEYYTLVGLCKKFNLSYPMVYQRVHIMKWDLLRALGCENHRLDHYITENLLEMKV
jgi:hypothetical protein